MGLGHKMTQITFKPLEYGDSEYGVRSCPKKDHNHIAYFLCGHGVMLYRENWIFIPFFNLFCPNRSFYTPKITNFAEKRGEKVIWTLKIFAPKKYLLYLVFNEKPLNF